MLLDDVLKPPALYTAEMMARRLGVKARWLRAEAEAGRIPHLKAGDRILLDPAAVERVLLERARSKPLGVPP